jgi:CRP-like cAMP-binding protein
MDALSKVSLFEKFDDAELAALKSLTKEESFRADHSIFFQGDKSYVLYVILSGAVKIVARTPDGKETLLSTMGPGQFFGELAVIDTLPRSATVVTTEPTTTLSIGHKDFRDFAVSHPEALWKVSVALCGISRTRGLDQLSREFHDVPYRLLAAIVRFSKRHGEKLAKAGVRINIRLTTQDLATTVGANEKSVKRLINAFQDEGLIHSEGGYIIVPDPVALERSLEYSDDKEWY